MKTTLLIMAAGIGSRFGGGIKQLAPVGPNGEIIMDYSIHDAIEAGFDKIVFIIRRDIEKDFREVIGERIEKVCAAHDVEVGYCFQSLKDIPEGNTIPEGRTKPLGTGQAVLAARELIHEPFVVLNADDYYGKEAFVRLHEFLIESAVSHAETGIPSYCMAGFILKNTLSDNGGVTRGVCKVDAQNSLLDINETKNIVKLTDESGNITVRCDAGLIDPDSYVSMNMWGLTPDFMRTLEYGFEEFFRKDMKENPMKAEYLLPILIGNLLKQQKVFVKVLPTEGHWFGVTYQEDSPLVVASFEDLIRRGVYETDLFSDLRK